MWEIGEKATTKAQATTVERQQRGALLCAEAQTEARSWKGSGSKTYTWYGFGTRALYTTIRDASRVEPAEDAERLNTLRSH